MSKWGRLVTICGSSLCFTGFAVAGDTIESVEQAIIELGKKIESMQFKSTMDSDFDQPGFKYKQNSEGTYHYAVDGDKMLFRVESNNVSVMGQEGGEQTTKTHMLMVGDGTFVWVLSESDGQKSVMKQKPTNANWFISKAYFDNLRTMYNLKLLPDETIDGRPMWVIEASPKPEMASNPGVLTMTIYHDKESGAGYKTVSKNGEGKTVSTSTTSDLKVNSGIDKSLFTFKVPDGVQVIDMTQQQQPGAQPASEPPSNQDTRKAEPEKPKQEEEPAPKEEKKDNKPKLPKLPKWP